MSAAFECSWEKNKKKMGDEAGMADNEHLITQFGPSQG